MYRLHPQTGKISIAGLPQTLSGRHPGGTSATIIRRDTSLFYPPMYNVLTPPSLTSPYLRFKIVGKPMKIVQKNSAIIQGPCACFLLSPLQMACRLEFFPQNLLLTLFPPFWSRSVHFRRSRSAHGRRCIYMVLQCSMVAQLSWEYPTCSRKVNFYS